MCVVHNAVMLKVGLDIWRLMFMHFSWEPITTLTSHRFQGLTTFSRNINCTLAITDWKLYNPDITGRTIRNWPVSKHYDFILRLSTSATACETHGPQDQHPMRQEFRSHKPLNFNRSSMDRRPMRPSTSLGIHHDRHRPYCRLSFDWDMYPDWLYFIRPDFVLRNRGLLCKSMFFKSWRIYGLKLVKNFV